MAISAFDRVEEICGIRRNCLYKQFLLFTQYFQKASFPDASKGVIVWEWVNHIYLAKGNFVHMILSYLVILNQRKWVLEVSCNRTLLQKNK